MNKRMMVMGVVVAVLCENDDELLLGVGTEGVMSAVSGRQCVRTCLVYTGCITSITTILY